MFFDGWQSLQHTLVVGVLSYIGLIVLLRLSGKRTLANWNAFDFIVTVAFGSTLATTLLSQNVALAQGLLGLALLVLLQYVITKLSVHLSWVRPIVTSEPTMLLYRGQIQEHVLRRERVTRSEVLAALRNRGIAQVEDAAAVVLETDGSFSVIQSLDEGPGSTLRDVYEHPGHDPQSPENQTEKS